MQKTCECGHKFEYTISDIKNSHRIMCGDSTKKDDVARLMGDKKADMVFTDPPFPNNSKIMEEMIVGIDDAFINARNVCNHTMLWFWDNLQNAPFLEKINARHIWHKTNGWQAGHFEMINEYRGNQERGECKVYSFPNVGVIKRKDVGNHLTPKPILLIETILREKTAENNIISDLFLGSGSTLIASEKTNRICYGMELDPKYVDVIIKRWEDYTQQKAVKLQ
jgi:DNA modification methylase